MLTPSKRLVEPTPTGSWDIATVLPLLSQRSGDLIHHDRQDGRAFECKTCSRKFSSFQALGGHRTGHKRPRLSPSPPAEVKTKVHSCPVCGVGFVTGQALGGNMRRHKNVCLDLKLSQTTKTAAPMTTIPVEGEGVDGLLSLRLGIGF